MATAGVPLWSTTAASNATADPAVNWAEGMAPSAVNNSARAEMASVAKWRDDIYGITAGLATGGTSTAFTVTTNATYATAAVMAGAIFTIVPHTTSGAAPTLAVDGLTARALNFSTGVAIPTGALISGTPYFVRYVHGSTEFIVIGPSKAPLTGADIIGGTSLTTPEDDDTLPIYDLSATANKRILVSDFFKVINEFTADATPDSAADYVVTYDASATGTKKVLLANLPSNLPRGHIDGMILSNGTDATNDINIAPGKCRDSTDAADIIIPTALGKQLDADFDVGGTTGTPTGGRNSAVGITDTTYQVWVARTSASTAGQVYFHTSADAATVLTALNLEGAGTYAYLRHIGAIVRATTILGFTQDQDTFWLNVPVLDVDASNFGASAVTRTLASCPTGVAVTAIFNALIRGATSGSITAYFSPLTSTDAAASVTAAPLGQLSTANAANADSSDAGQFRILTNASAQFRSRLTACSTNDTLRIATVGWVHPRGKNA